MTAMVNQSGRTPFEGTREQLWSFSINIVSHLLSFIALYPRYPCLNTTTPTFISPHFLNLPSLFPQTPLVALNPDPSIHSTRRPSPEMQRIQNNSKSQSGKMTIAALGNTSSRTSVHHFCVTFLKRNICVLLQLTVLIR